MSSNLINWPKQDGDLMDDEHDLDKLDILISNLEAAYYHQFRSDVPWELAQAIEELVRYRDA